ncbi:hypothetical protein [Glutamicibacter sp. NPDC087344]|uniref:hypothetical protein n=1 Tax=Glutamicibacter sp. NPDC087344 TaxID=3363994 RepID=UPI00380905D3
MNDTDSLKGLIEMAVERHQTSARQLAFKAQEAGLKITYTTLNQIRSNTYKSVPGEQTLRAIAWLAGVEDSVAFTAAGQPVPGPPLADELPPGADNLSPKSRKAVVEMVRVLVDLETGSNAQRTPDSNDAPTQLRAVAPTRDSGPGQKIEFPDSPEEAIEKLRLKKAHAAKGSESFGITEIHGAEAAKYPAPPIEQLAAHPKVKTRREQLDEQTGGDETNSRDDH